MSLTGERLRQLLQANSLNRKQKRRTPRQCSETTGEDDHEDNDDKEPSTKDKNKGTETATPIETPYTACYTIAGSGQTAPEQLLRLCNQDAFNCENCTSVTTPSATTYTASVTDDLVFEKLDRQSLPSGIKLPRGPSVNVYVLDKELTERVKIRNSVGLRRRISKRVNEFAIPPRRQSDRGTIPNGKGTGVTDTAPAIPQKPRTIPPSPGWNKDLSRSINSEERQDQTYQRSPEPPLPLPPRRNKPQPTSISPRAPPKAAEMVSSRTTSPRENAGNIIITVDDKFSKDDDEENGYEPVETPCSKQLESTPKVKIPNRPDNDIADITSLDDMQESDSVFDYRSYGLSPVSSGSRGRDGSDRSRKNNQSGTDESGSFGCLQTNGRLDSDSTLRLQSEIALPKLTKGQHSDYTTESESEIETDTYEAIDGALRGRTVDAIPQGAVFPFDGREYDDVAESEDFDGDRLVIRRDDIVIVETGEVNQNEDSREKPEAQSDLNLDTEGDLARFTNTLLSYDKDGNSVYIPSDKLKIYGDPSGEPWFYPLELSSREATLFLRSEHKEGCFLVYRSPSGHTTSAYYNLSISRGNGDVLHYRIVEAPQGGFVIEGHERSFLNLADLVEYFKRNKSSLATRLRRPLKEARLPITAGYHYDLKYELDRNRLSLTGSIIGKGNFGVVCSGLYKSVPVAVKVLQGTEISLEDEDDFIEEARVLMMLSHDHIVRIIGVSSSSRPFFLVTEFIQHGNLKECLRNGQIPTDKPDVYFDICTQMLAALSYLDSIKYILHRDIAARNFLVADLKCIKLADFGRARYVTDDSYQAPRTEKISIKWAAPEVLFDFRYSTKSDIWAVGIAMWEVYSIGQRPYESLSAEQTAVYVTEGGRLARPTLCPEEVYSCVRKCWRRTPASRPSAAVLQQTILEDRQAAIYRRNLKKLEEASLAIAVSVPRPKSKSPLTPTLKKKNLYNETGKERLSTIRNVFLTSSFRESPSMKKSDSHERLPTSSSSDMSSLSSAPDTTTSQRIRESFRKLIITKKMRSSSKSKADYIMNQKSANIHGLAEI